MSPDIQTKRCAIYTRKSVEQPTHHQFGSLEAQRAICASYVASQEPNGWTEIPKHYDDNGVSGGSLERPALQELLIDIESGLIDVVVIYKLDRITRTLLDFVRLIDLFDQCGVTFVAVTQNFDTSNSTGRLIQNVLLTFAQFEREIASDRLRDKFCAMKQRGLFIGGHPPYGFDLVDKRLVINDEEAVVVRWMFERYLETKSYTKIEKELADRGIVRRTRTSKRGHKVVGRNICKSSVWNMLGNPIYVGQVRNKGTCYPGAHEALISSELWEDVQKLRAARTRGKVVERYKTDLLRDLIFDGFGRKMGVYRDWRYSQMRRYYISNQTEWGRRHGARRYRTKADELEGLTVAAVASLLADRQKIRGLLIKSGIHDGRLNALSSAGSRSANLLQASTVRQKQCVLRALIERIELSSTHVNIIVRVPELSRFLGWDGTALFRGDVDAWSRPHATEALAVATNAICMKRELTLLLKRKKVDETNKPNPRLVALLNRSRAAQSALDDRSINSVGELAARVHCHPKRYTRLVRLNYLAPDIAASIRDGTQPSELSCRTLMAAELPMDWALQRRMLGFPDQPDFLKAAPGW